MSDNDFNKGVEADLDPAIEHFRQKTAMTREQIDALSAEMRRRVFFITGLADLELIKRVQLSLAKSMENGETFKDWKKRIRQELTDPKFTEKRLRTIFRTNVQNIFATGRYAALTSDAARKRKPYWKFSAIRDGRTTRVCKQSHGVILHMDHPWWKNHIPPLHFNCRSTIVPLSEKEARAAGITQFPPEELPPLGFGHLPDPIITASGQVPSEEERQKREQLADEAREAEERATAAAQKATEARKNLRKAKKHNIAQLPAAEKALRAAEKQAAIEEKKARAKGENVPRNWQPTEAGLIRRFGKALAAPFIEVWRAIGNRWDQFKTGDLMRLLTDETGSMSIEFGSVEQQVWNKAVEQAQKEGKTWNPLNPKELRAAQNAGQIPKDASKVQPPKSKHIAVLGKKWKLGGAFLSFVTEDRREEVERDLEAIRAGKLKPTWIKTKDGQGRDIFTAGYVGSGGIHYRVGREGNHLMISSGKGVWHLERKQIDALKFLMNNKLNIDKTVKQYPKQEDIIKEFAKVISGE